MIKFKGMNNIMQSAVDLVEVIFTIIFFHFNRIISVDRDNRATVLIYQPSQPFKLFGTLLNR